MGSFRRRSARAACVLGLLLLMLAAVAGAPAVEPAAARGASAPVITLLSPANGATFVSSASLFPTFRWQISWDTPETTIVSFETAADPAFSQNVSVDNKACPSTNVSCWTSVQPRSVYAPPYGNVWYWRVGLTTSAGTVYSPTWTFTAVNPPTPPKPKDRDRDGVPDSSDNCPGVANPSQRDSNHDHTGDACQPDHVPPQLKVPAGHGARGKTLFASFWAGDDRGMIRMHLTFSYEGHILISQPFGWRPSAVGQHHTFYSLAPLPRSLPAGIYMFCVKVWDHAGSHASGCGRYTIS